MKIKTLSLSVLLIASLAFVSCKKEPDLGSVLLDPSEKQVTFGQTFTIKPIYSETGIAKDKTYAWSSNADSIASVKVVTGGFGEVTPKRIGEATITYASTDGLISKTAKVTVNPRSTILNGIYYAKGATKSQIRNNMTSGFDELASESDDNFMVFKSGSSTITKLVYEMENGSLKALYIILADNTNNKENAEKYIEERFVNTGKTQSGILYFENTGFVANNAIPVGSVIGIFIDNTVNGIEYPLGVKVMDKSQL